MRSEASAVILIHDDIIREIKAGSLYIGKSRKESVETRFELDFDESQVRESSVDLPVGNQFLRWMSPEEIERDAGLSSKERRVPLNLPDKQMADELESLQQLFTEESKISPDGFISLQPREFVLVQLAQFIHLPDYLAGRV